MTNIFMLYMPPTNYEAQVHYEDTIKERVEQSVIYQYVNQDLRSILSRIFGPHKIAVWGSRNSNANRAKFDKMKPGDEILIVEGDTIKLLGKVAAKTINPDLSRTLWKNLRGGSSDGWDLIYFIANPLEIGVPFSEFNRLFNYAPNYKLQGFTSVSQTKLDEFYGQYDDLYSILVKIRNGEVVDQLSMDQPALDLPEQQLPAVAVQEQENNNSDQVSDHILMQCRLANLGKKAGSKVWVPTGDQGRVQSACDFNEFETDFTSGIDTQAKYVENIDVVWKEEFRIDAAFEIENSTAIYSGLLRFADLNLVAPNTIYPLFIVAPTSKKNRLREQLMRPIFRQLGLHKKVLYLSYDKVEEIDEFFSGTNAGLNIDLIRGKAEQLIDS